MVPNVEKRRHKMLENLASLLFGLIPGLSIYSDLSFQIFQVIADLRENSYCIFWDRRELQVTGGFRGKHSENKGIPFLGSIWLCNSLSCVTNQHGCEPYNIAYDTLG